MVSVEGSEGAVRMVAMRLLFTALQVVLEESRAVLAEAVAPRKKRVSFGIAEALMGLRRRIATGYEK
jgi:hypothetical protein